ncbi:methyltransferase [Microbacterium sp.]|uniref:DUF7059 domain-containing protein n=1 Tax=Microbacterium sp. TaxID=51671 RepID=UPI0039E6C203
MTPDPALCAALRADLTAAGYTAGAARAAWGEQADDAIRHGLAGPARAALAGRTDALAVLCRALFLAEAFPAHVLDTALPRTGSAGLIALRLARPDGALVRPVATVRPQELEADGGAQHWWIAADPDEAVVSGPLGTGHVLGVGGASLTLAGLQPSSAVGRVLDVGTGCGIQALRARLSADRVVATDTSIRALEYTRLNALLNGVDGIEVRRGSLFEPVAGEQFDRVVSNPPFVVTPRVAGVPTYEYRDGGLTGDELIAAFVRGVGAVLAPAGTAHLLGNWEYREGEDGLDRVQQWVAASNIPLDAWIVERELLAPLAYAELWVRDGGTAPGSGGYAELVEAWLDDFAARSVTAIGFGYLLLRRPASGVPTLARYERVTRPVRDGLGAHVEAALAVHDALEALDEAGLAASVLVVAADVTEARHHLPGAEAPSVIELHQGGAFGRVIEVDPALAALVGACDGDLAVGPLVDAIAELLEVDAAALRADVLPRVRDLLFTGFLRFA